MFWIYFLQNPDGRIYIGQTDRLEWHLQQHNDPVHTLTRTTERFRGPWKLVHREQFASRSEALAREKALKSAQDRAWLKNRLGYAAIMGADGAPPSSFLFEGRCRAMVPGSAVAPGRCRVRPAPDWLKSPAYGRILFPTTPRGL